MCLLQHEDFLLCCWAETTLLQNISDCLRSDRLRDGGIYELSGLNGIIHPSRVNFLNDCCFITSRETTKRWWAVKIAFMIMVKGKCGWNQVQRVKLRQIKSHHLVYSFYTLPASYSGLKDWKTCLKMQGQKTAPISGHFIYFIDPLFLIQITWSKIYIKDIMSYIFIWFNQIFLLCQHWVIQWLKKLFKCLPVLERLY